MRSEGAALNVQYRRWLRNSTSRARLLDLSGIQQRTTLMVSVEGHERRQTGRGTQETTEIRQGTQDRAAHEEMILSLSDIPGFDLTEESGRKS